MRKYLLLILITVLLFSCSTFVKKTSDIPSPFDKIKEACLKVDPNNFCRYLIHLDLVEDGQPSSYIMAYLPTVKIIGIGQTRPKVFVIEYHADSKEFFLYEKDGKRTSMDKDEAIKNAEQFYKKFVLNNAIK